MNEFEFEKLQESNRARITLLQEQGVTFDQRIAQDMTFQQILEDLYPADSEERMQFTARVEARVAKWLDHIEVQATQSLQEARAKAARQTLLGGAGIYPPGTK